MNEQIHKYTLLNCKREFSSPEDKEGTLTFQPIEFYTKLKDGTELNGTLVEEVLRVCIDRLNFLGEESPCFETTLARLKLEEALTWLNK